MSCAYPTPLPPRIVGDLRPLAQKVRTGEMTRKEFEEIFNKSREHGYDGSIDFPVGASTSPKIMGISANGTAKGEYCKRFNLYRKLQSKAEIIWPFEIGHMVEDIILEVFSLKTGLEATKCDIQVSNPNWPSSLVNADGFVWEVDPVTGKLLLGLAEIKTTYTSKSEHAELFKLDIIPDDYMVQVQHQMEVWNLDFCYLIHATGWADYQQKHFRIERDRDLGVAICTACEEFAQACRDGRMPDNRYVERVEGIIKDNVLLYPYGDKKLPKVKLPKECVKMLQAAEDLKAEIAALDNTIKVEKNRLKKEYDEKIAKVMDYMGDHTLGEVIDGSDAYLVRFHEACEPSFNKAAKELIRKDYPDLWETLMDMKPGSRKFEYEKLKTRAM